MAKNIQSNEVAEMDLFDVLNEEEKKELGWDEPETSCCAAPTSKKTAKKTQPVEAEPNEYPVDRVVFYAGHRMNVPARTMKKEDVRAWLEETFPELSAERTEMVYDEKTGHLIPVLKAHKKGAKTIEVYLEEPEQTLPAYYRLGKGGDIEEVRTTQAGRFVLPLETALDRAQHVRVFGQYIPKVALPSVSFLKEIVDRFVAEPDTEHVAYLVWDTDHYEVVWPTQKANAVSVVASGMMETETRFIWMQIHSHGRLDAFWSGTDDADEVRTGLYGVVGRVQDGIPSAKFRMSVGGRFMDLPETVCFRGDVHAIVWGYQQW